MTEHTPTNWIMRKATKGGYTVESAEDGSPIVCHMDEELRHGPIDSEDNARLIAAAPDMLASIEWSIACLESSSDGGVTYALDLLRSAYAKAGGEE